VLQMIGYVAVEKGLLALRAIPTWVLDLTVRTIAEQGGHLVMN